MCIVVGALSLWNVSTSLYMMWIGYSPLPSGDQWDTALFPDESIRNLFAQHNERRPTLGRLLGLLDWYLASARNVINISFIALCYPVFTLALFMLVDTIVGNWRRSALVAVLALAIIVSALQWGNLLWRFQTAFVGSFILAFLSLFFARRASQKPQSVARTTTSFGLCLMSSFFAAFSLASGLLTLIFVPMMLFILNASAKLQYSYVAFAAATLVAYFYDYASPVDRFRESQGICGRSATTRSPISVHRSRRPHGFGVPMPASPIWLLLLEHSAFCC